MSRNIIVVTTVHKWNDVRIFEKQVKSLAKEYNVFYIAPAEFDTKIIDNIKIIGLPIYRSRKKRFNNLFRAIKLCNSIEAKCIHFHDPELLILGILFKLFSRKKVIYDIHEDYSKAILNKYWINKKFRRIISIIFNCFEKFSVNYILDAACVTTNLIREQFSKEKSIVINNYPVDFTNSACIIPKHEDDFLNITVTGSLCKERGILNTIKAINKLKDLKIRLYLIGTFNDDLFKNEVDKYISENGLISAVKIMNSLPYRDMFEFLKRMDVGIVPYLPDPNHLVTLPNKIFEYMESGLAVIASNFPLYRNVIEESSGGVLFNPVDIDDLADKIRYFYDNENILNYNKKNALKAFKEKFNWGEEEKKLIKLYSDLLNVKNNV